MKKAVFADSYFFLALLNPRDQAHDAAKTIAAETPKLLTTQWVLTEVGDAMARPPDRPRFERLLELLASDSEAEIVSASATLFQRATELYFSRPDKEWTLTDCTSFVVMSERSISKALTGDRHFEQAGFERLM